MREGGEEEGGEEEGERRGRRGGRKGKREEGRDDQIFIFPLGNYIFADSSVTRVSCRYGGVVRLYLKMLRES